MTKVLVSWLGRADFEGISKGESPGPLLRILEEAHFEVLYLLQDGSFDPLDSFLSKLGVVFSGDVVVKPVQLTSPIHFGDIYTAFDGVMAEAAKRHPGANITIQLTSGTPAMSAVSILVGKAKYSARFLQASREQGVKEEVIPFDIAADFLPALVERNDQQLKNLMEGVAPTTAAFDHIITQNPIIQELKQRAAMIAQRNVPVLIYGETGTGKELFAKAIRNSSPRANKPFLTLNCGAIAKDLIDSTLFGHAKGAFTGATAAHKGYFAQADGGTLFLDEFGELPLDSQVRLLRVLQDGTFTPVGSTSEQQVNVRIIAATNKDLIHEVANGHFREDLFYRVAIGVLNLPPLRARPEDLGLLANNLLEQINNDAACQIGYKHKKLSAKAKKVIQTYSWPGNVRELYATLLRASLWQPGERLTDLDIKHALQQLPAAKDPILGREITEGIDINGVIEEVCTHYIERAMAHCHANKSKAAALLGLKNYQTLNNWMEKYGIK
ncbi:sigma-54 interaction domain-containing protein [Spartinivicinus ruber]|uniref:sigma-54 interaction domain-containing protein n=1 Tax=Spartinivicinus ruber TaxID=2683272 RepID=UPI0013D83604|nr:sigma-54 dependent transcriptional regulator [Spartinivicinus ruber]